MFVTNATSLDVSLARGHVSDELAVAAVVVSSVLRIEGDALVPFEEPLPPAENDPPAMLARLPLWAGVSVTAAGVALGPAAPPHVCPVLFRIGTAERRLIVFGERRWQRRLGGALERSAPAPFDKIELSFTRAFGGGYDVPPGVLPGTDLPHPGLRVAYPLNEHGVGYYPHERLAVGAALPSIERPDQLLRAWNDTPEPAGFTPCQDLLAWRMKDDAAARGAGPADAAALFRDFTPPLRIYHHAPPSLIFQDVPPGTPIELYGLGVEPARFVLPRSPARVRVRVRREQAEIQPRLRALHVDAERRAVRLVFDHTFHYDPRRAPRWIRVEASEGGAG
jgi:hypothetical protein